ncbi:hypothetical protein HYPSUDRAFT_149614 [Hypholoma sublateritium FD-334 SS-4]|uniref:Secreted protein n=1 Tax=Hypholoma sublateritium (strain FD-334 SS-4) TaxID=945553 RepID=A0A0D2NEJ6_HYPSF|nr:hypothetical protein HYPSUDRAFT_149614 [Hypholoma sublateritium FD-334 SS-4]
MFIDGGARGIVEMLFCTSLIVLVGAADQPQSSPRKLQIVNTKVTPSIYTYEPLAGGPARSNSIGNELATRRWLGTTTPLGTRFLRTQSPIHQIASQR